MVPEVPTDYTIRPGTPTVVTATGKDGRQYRIEIQLGILNLREADTVNPVNGLPAFELEFGINMTQSVVTKP
jgi:hypothetical protein